MSRFLFIATFVWLSFPVFGNALRDCSAEYRNLGSRKEVREALPDWTIRLLADAKEAAKAHMEDLPQAAVAKRAARKVVRDINKGDVEGLSQFLRQEIHRHRTDLDFEGSPRTSTLSRMSEDREGAGERLFHYLLERETPLYVKRASGSVSRTVISRVEQAVAKRAQDIWSKLREDEHFRELLSETIPDTTIVIDHAPIRKEVERRLSADFEADPTRDIERHWLIRNEEKAANDIVVAAIRKRVRANTYGSLGRKLHAGLRPVLNPIRKKAKEGSVRKRIAKRLHSKTKKELGKEFEVRLETLMDELAQTANIEKLPQWWRLALEESAESYWHRYLEREGGEQFEREIRKARKKALEKVETAQKQKIESRRGKEKKSVTNEALENWEAHLMPQLAEMEVSARERGFDKTVADSFKKLKPVGGAAAHANVKNQKTNQEKWERELPEAIEKLRLALIPKLQKFFKEDAVRTNLTPEETQRLITVVNGMFRTPEDFARVFENWGYESEHLWKDSPALVLARQFGNLEGPDLIEKFVLTYGDPYALGDVLKGRIQQTKVRVHDRMIEYLKARSKEALENEEPHEAGRAFSVAADFREGKGLTHYLWALDNMAPELIQWGGISLRKPVQALPLDEIFETIAPPATKMQKGDTSAFRRARELEVHLPKGYEYTTDKIFVVMNGPGEETLLTYGRLSDGIQDQLLKLDPDFPILYTKLQTACAQADCEAAAGTGTRVVTFQAQELIDLWMEYSKGKGRDKEMIKGEEVGVMHAGRFTGNKGQRLTPEQYVALGAIGLYSNEIPKRFPATTNRESAGGHDPEAHRDLIDEAVRAFERMHLEEYFDGFKRKEIHDVLQYSISRFNGSAQRYREAIESEIRTLPEDLDTESVKTVIEGVERAYFTAKANETVERKRDIYQLMLESQGLKRHHASITARETVEGFYSVMMRVHRPSWWRKWARWIGFKDSNEEVWLTYLSKDQLEKLLPDADFPVKEDTENSPKLVHGVLPLAKLSKNRPQPGDLFQFLGVKADELEFHRTFKPDMNRFDGEHGDWGYIVNEALQPLERGPNTNVQNSNDLFVIDENSPE